MLAGDARCVLGRASDKGISHASKAVVLTKEHKALFSEERKRIEKAGGFVRNGRLQGDSLCSTITLHCRMRACLQLDIAPY